MNERRIFDALCKCVDSLYTRGFSCHIQSRHFPQTGGNVWDMFESEETRAWAAEFLGGRLTAKEFSIMLTFLDAGLAPKDREFAEAHLSKLIPATELQEFGRRVFLVRRLRENWKLHMASMFTIPPRKVVELVDETLLSDSCFFAVCDWLKRVSRRGTHRFMVRSDYFSAPIGVGYSHWNARPSEEPEPARRLAIVLRYEDGQLSIASVFPDF